VKLEAIIQRKQAEEPLWWHTKSLLIERHKGTTYPSKGAGNAGSSSTWQASSSVTTINPCFTSFCRWPGVMVEGVQSYSAVALGGREGNTFEILIFFPMFLLFCSLPFPPRFSFLSPREGGRDRIVDGEKGYRGAQG
jgi:hypothetical protein